MELHVLLAGIEFGPYSDDKARQLLGEGFLSASDPAKRTDGTNWIPLSEVLGKIPDAEESVVTRDAAPPVFVPPSGYLDEPVEEAEGEPEQPPLAEDVEPEPAESFSPVDEPEPPPEEPAAKAPEPEEIAPIPEARPPQGRIVPENPPFFVSEPPAISPAAAASPAAPKLQVSVPQRGKKGVGLARTGSLMAKEALQAARDRSGILPPTRPVLSTTTAPVPEFEPEPAPPRKRTPVKLGDQPPPEEPAPPPQRKAIKLTGRISIGLPGTAPQLDRAEEPKAASAPSAPLSSATSPPARSSSPRATTAPRLPASELAKFSGFIARPSDLARGKAEPAPESKTGPILLRERRETAALKTPPRKTIKLTGPISLAGRTTGPTPAARPPQTDDDDGPMVMARTRTVPTPPPPEPAVPASAKPPAEEPMPPAVPPSESAGPLQRGAEIAAAAALAEEIASTTNEPSEPSAGEPLSASGSLLSSGELAEKRSLKITGSLKHPSPTAGPIQLSSPSAESGPLVPVIDDRPAFSPPMLMPTFESDRAPSSPVPEEHLVNRPPSGKIPVSEMPTEGVKVHARRLTSKVPLPVSPAESLAHESPARQFPPPLPKKKIELPTPPAFETRAVVPPEPASQPMSREEFEAASPAALPQPSPAVVSPLEEVTRSPFSPEPAAMESPIEAEPAVSLEEQPLSSPEEATAEAAPAATAKPEQVRLRRPVKLELTSRKGGDSGRLTLEAFSKIASQEKAPESVSAAATPAVAEGAIEPITKAPPSAPEPKTETPVINSTSVLNYPKRLEEAPQVMRGESRRKREGTSAPVLGWILYSIIGVGIVSACIVALLVWHRSNGASASADTETPAASTLPSPPPSAPPPSASPPAAASATPAAATAPTASASTPAAAAPSAAPSPATNAAAAVPAAPVPPPAPITTAPDLQRQSSAFVSDGILKYQHGDLDGAIAAYAQALDLDPKSSTAYFNRGIAKAAHDDLDGAIADYTQALQLDPTMAAAYYYRGLARHSKAELDGAVADYDQAIQMDPRNPLAYFNRGLIRMQKDDVDGAVVDSSRAVELDPHLVQSYYDRGLGRMAKGAMDAALSDMKLFTEQAPQDAYTDYARLYIWLIQTRAGQLAEANQELSKAMNSAWNGTPDAMVTRIGEYLLGQISEEDLIKASASAIPVKDQGQRCEAWYFVGMRKLVEGDKDAAIEALRKCVGTQKTDYCEYILAEEQLRNLSAGSPPTGTMPPPPAPRALPVTLPDPGTIAPAPATPP